MPKMPQQKPAMEEERARKVNIALLFWFFLVFVFVFVSGEFVCRSIMISKDYGIFMQKALYFSAFVSRNALMYA